MLQAVLNPKVEPYYEYVRWRQVAGCIMASIIIGAVFSYPLLAKPMADVFNMTQTQVTWVTMCSWVFGLFTLPTGFALDRFGPRVVNTMTFIMMVVGFLLMGLWFSLADASDELKAGEKAPVWRVALIAATYSLLCWAASFMDVGLLLPSMSVFPRAKHDIVIIAKPFMGLGGSIFATWYIGFFDSRDGAKDMAGYYFFVAALCAVCGAAAVWSLPHHLHQTEEHADADTKEGAGSREPAGESSDEAAKSDTAAMFRHWRTTLPPRGIVRFGFGALALSVIFMTSVAAVQSFSQAFAQKNKEPNPVPRAVEVLFSIGAALCILFFWFMPLLARLGIFSPILVAPSAADAMDRAAAGEASTAEEEMAKAVKTVDDKHRGKLVLRSDSVLESMKSPMFWLLYVTLGVMWGSSATITGNSTFFYASVLDSCNDYDATLNATFVIIVSVCSSLGRIAAGAIERLFPRMPPTAYLWVAPLCLGLSHAVYSIVAYADNVNPATLSIASALHGFGDGVGWAGAALVVSNLYGPTSVGTHYSIIATSGMITIPILLQGVVAPLERRARSNGAKGSWCCLGEECYGRSTAIASGFCVIGIVSGLALHAFWLWRRGQQYAEEGEPTSSTVSSPADDETEVA